MAATPGREPIAARAGRPPLGGAGVTGYHPGQLSGIPFACANRRPTPIGGDDGILTAKESKTLNLVHVDIQDNTEDFA